MLELTVREGNRVIVLKFEHSLRSLSKWESIHKKAFLATPVKEPTEMIEYFQCMLLKPSQAELIYRVTPEQLEELTKYINTSQTASSVPPSDGRGPREIITSELIYSWMVGLRIDWEAQDWHLSRLTMLIEIVNYKQQPEKKRSTAQVLKDWRAMNAENKKLLNTTG